MENSIEERKKEYTVMILPIIEFNVKDPNSSFERYLYYQSFYGYSRFFPQPISNKIVEMYSKQNINPIEEYIRNNRGLKGDFILEHIWTGGMFRDEMKSLYLANHLTVEKIVEVVNKNFAMGWMTKDEKRNRKDYKIRNSKRQRDEIEYLKSLLSSQNLKQN